MICAMRVWQFRQPTDFLVIIASLLPDIAEQQKCRQFPGVWIRSIQVVTRHL